MMLRASLTDLALFIAFAALALFLFTEIEHRIVLHGQRQQVDFGFGIFVYRHLN